MARSAVLRKLIVAHFLTIKEGENERKITALKHSARGTFPYDSSLDLKEPALKHKMKKHQDNGGKVHQTCALP